MVRRVGRYVVLDKLASGGMGTVHFGRLDADGGFSRPVAIKALHAQYASDPGFREMFLDEARIVSRIQHLNVVGTLDVLEDQGELFLIMEYVEGLPLSTIMQRLFPQSVSVPIATAIAIACDALDGLHAAHEARSDMGEPLRIVHRDVSPQNILVTRDGVARLLDFGVAHAADRGQRTRPGEVKGKASYMAPEQAQGLPVDRRSDTYAAAIVLWELLTGQRLFGGETYAESILRQIQMRPPLPSSFRPDVSPALDAVILRGLEKDPGLRFGSADEMARALEGCATRAGRPAVAAFVAEVGAEFFQERAALLARTAQDRAEALREGTKPAFGARPMDVESSGPSETPTVRHPAAVSPAASPSGSGGQELPVTGPLPAPRRRAFGVAAALAVVGIAGLGMTVVTLRKTPPATRTAPVTPTLSTTQVVGASPVASSGDASALAPVDSTVAVSVPSAQAPRRSVRSRDPGASGAPSPLAAPASSLPPCCAGSIHIRFSQCADNCPK